MLLPSLSTSPCIHYIACIRNSQSPVKVVHYVLYTISQRQAKKKKTYCHLEQKNCNAKEKTILSPLLYLPYAYTQPHSLYSFPPSVIEPHRSSHHARYVQP